MHTSELMDLLESAPVIALPATLSSGAPAASTSCKEIWYE